MMSWEVIAFSLETGYGTLLLYCWCLTILGTLLLLSPLEISTDQSPSILGILLDNMHFDCT